MDQYLSNDGEGCMGFIFIVKGLIKIQRMNAGGKETNLYDLKEGQLCNELSNCFKEEDNLNICEKQGFIKMLRGKIQILKDLNELL